MTNRLSPARARLLLALYVLIPALLMLGPLPVRLLDLTAEVAGEIVGVFWDDAPLSRRHVEVACNVLIYIPIGALLQRGAPILAPSRAVVMSAVASACVELLQVAALPGRYGSLRDVALNTVGAAVGVWVVNRQPR